MQESDPHVKNSRSFEQTNVGATQIIHNYFNETRSPSKRKWQGVMIMTTGILLVTISLFTMDYLPFSITMALSGLLLIPGAGRTILGVFQIPLTNTVRRIVLVVLLTLNLPLAVVFTIKQTKLTELLRTELIRQRQAFQQTALKNQQRKDSLFTCMQVIDSLHRKGETDKALIQLDKADLLAKTSGEKADVEQQRVEVSLTKATELIDKHRYNMAIDLLNDVYVLDTNNTGILYQRALCYQKTDNVANAVSDAKKAMLQGHTGAAALYEKINPLKKRIAYYTTKCRDGSYSDAKGSGACSHHGGVANWNYPVYESYRQYE